MSCVSAFCNILHFIGEIFGIPENVPSFQKNVFHIPDERQLGLASLVKGWLAVFLRGGWQIFFVLFF